MSRTTAPDPILLTIADCARILQLGRTVVYQLARTGKIPAIRIGKAIRVPRQALLESLGVSKPAPTDRLDRMHGQDYPTSSRAVKGRVTFQKDSYF